MATDRSAMTVRVVPLRSAEAGDSRVGGTPTDRLALVVTLSEHVWARTLRPLPTYTRETMPFTLTALRAQSDRD